MATSTNTTATKSLSEINKQTVKALKIRIKGVGTMQVCRRIGFTEQNLSYHLNPKDYTKVNIGILEKITGAVEALEKEKLERSEKLHSKATQSITK